MHRKLTRFLPKKGKKKSNLPKLKVSKNRDYIIGQKSLKFIYSEKATRFLKNLHRRFDRCYKEQIYGGDLAKTCGHLKIY